MNRKKIALGIIIFLVVSPIVGMFLRPLQVFVPMARTFDQPADAPPFAESLLPLFGLLTILIGTICFLVYFTNRRYTSLKFFCVFNIVYSCLALLIWFVFFGSRFVINFPVKEVGFYVIFVLAVAPHMLWILLLVWCIRAFKKLPVPVQINAEQANS
jgi:hypothetical protein